MLFLLFIIRHIDSSSGINKITCDVPRVGTVQYSTSKIDLQCLMDTRCMVIGKKVDIKIFISERSMFNV